MRPIMTRRARCERGRRRGLAAKVAVLTRNALPAVVAPLRHPAQTAEMPSVCPIWRCLVGLVLAVWLSACRAEAPALAQAPLEYVEVVTQAADRDAALPMLIVMHGLGDSPEGILPLFRDVAPATRIIAPRAPDAWGDGFSWYPVPKRSARVIADRARLVAELIEHLRARRPTRGRPVVTGFSQGGVLSFALAKDYASLLGGAVPIAGMLPPDAGPVKRPERPLPVYAFHGRDDQRIPFAAAERAVAQLKQAGFDATLTGFPGVGHSISPEMRSQIFARLSALLSE
jgi:phospholipase/carboxylesterase